MYRRLFRNGRIASLSNQSNQKKGTKRLALTQVVPAYGRNTENVPALGAAGERIARKHIGNAILLGHYSCAITNVLGNGWTNGRRFTVAEQQAEAGGLVSFVLRPEDGGRAVVHRAVQYLTLSFGAAGLPGVKRNHPISS
ncbi:MAG: hypothetical protein ACK41Y_07035 [Paracoccus hibiscisoli]|uniref:hypothetical protein n=1 Tax=Paracoccus hibiscisoli TaxID=2023261 RepID=UPI00391AB338